jgi:coenzyme PQQ synthesis protein D (PqqD)
MSGVSEGTVLPLARVDGLEINQEEDGFIVYQPETDRVHYFNHTGILILELCDGRRSPAEIADLLKRAYDLPEAPQREVDEVLTRMRDEGLVQETQ